MRVAVIGTGYVGLVTGTCLATMGNRVYCVDVDEAKIQGLRNGVIPIYEPGLEDMVKRNAEEGSLKFTTDLKEALQKAEVCFIAVGTPMGEDGSADLHYVLQVASQIGQVLDHTLVIVDKSTVPVGTAEKVRETVKKELDARGVDVTFHMVSNPEFLKEGNAVSDCMRPDRIVIGSDNEDAAEIMRELYKPFVMDTENFILMDIPSAEMTKYAANAMLATKISFINEIANICEKVGANVNKVRKGIGSDKRIGYSFIYPGIGFGGSCFPKDVRALLKTAEENGYGARLLKAVEDVNLSQKEVILRKVEEEFGSDLSGKVFAVWGLSFKPDTDDCRESAAIAVVKGLTERGAKVQAYDPKAMKEARDFYLKGNENVSYHDSKYEVLKEADALLLLTEWKEFRSPDFYEISEHIKTPIIFDGRNQYDAKNLARYQLRYVQVGVKSEKQN
ncbi:MAG: UDP-glucose/GDP-mannose dehydrogenase family protein [Lachnospiraceae bacterium]|nr:UDP-glucose/GDP-mannose dehydrogenase family protein [Lachnospiraceae bacterium]